MGIGRKTHNKKSDKETQSPVLKIFKDIMQKEKTDPEKVTLLKDKKQKEKRRKSYSESRSKSDQKSYDSSSTDIYRARPTKITVQDIQEDRNEGLDRNIGKPYQNEKRESWWLWGDNPKKKKTDDTCSCVSCALKKIITSEYTCIICLLLLFSISVVVIFIMVFKIPDSSCDEKSVQIKEKRQLTESYGYPMYTERNKWDSGVTSSMNYNDLPSEYVGAELKRSNFLDVMESGISGDLASALDNDKIFQAQSSERLRDFYKHLIQTDAQIRRLKEAINNNYYQNDKSFADRFKRSLRNKLKLNKTSNKNNNKNNITNISNKAQNSTKTNKSKRSPNNNNVTGIIVKNEKIMIQYEPYKEKFWKNLNTHEMKAYENKLHQSFFKMKQNILDMMKKKQQNIATTNKNIMTTRKYIITTNKNMLIASKHNREGERKVKEAKDDFIFTDYKMYEDNKEKTSKDKVTNIINNLDYDIKKLLLMSTHDEVSNISFTTPQYKEANIQNFQPGQRKLMQIEEDKEEFNYENIKEILNDEHQDRDDINREMERIKRDGEQQFNELKRFNWKRPMSLRSDELNAMIKQAAIQNLNIQIPVNTKDIKIEKEKEEKDISDTEYIEDYLDNKYNKMVKMAQAYSDYGVVYGKSDSNNNNNVNNKFKTKEQEGLKLKLPFDKQNLVNRFFRKLDRGFMKDGIKIEFKPGNVPTEHNHHAKGIEKHIKILNNPLENPNTFPLSKDYEKATSIINFETFTDLVPSEKPIMNNLRVKPGSRSLMFVDFDETFNGVKKKGSKNTPKSIKKSKDTSKSILDHIFLIISNWFKSMGYYFGKKLKKIKNLFINTNHIKPIITDINNRTLKDMTNSSYNIDNGNRKSRVLMSTEDNSKLKEDFKLNKINNNNFEKSNKNTDLDDTVPIALIIAKEMENASKDFSKEKSNITNKIIVKRSPKKVFWNDLYDNDEYGVQIDYLDGIRSKHCVNKNVVQKSKDWVKKKLHKVKDRFRKKKKEQKLDKTTTTCATMKRPIRQSDDNENYDIKKTFEKLTANMKKICQKAARDIENTKHIGVREENKEDKAATSLMQHLVRLMTDLVDIQVQQKTCAKLPSDLRDFLEWLTVPTDNNVVVDNLETHPGLFEYATVDDSGRYGKSTDPTQDLPTYNEDTHQDDRTECLGIIKSVQDLIQRYEEMTDEDKSKMTGVREYLENQLEFLNTKLGIISDYNAHKSYDKRQISRNTRFVWNNKNHRNNKINKFIRPFGKKHTKSTPHTYDGVTITKLKKKNKNKNADNAHLFSSFEHNI